MKFMKFDRLNVVSGKRGIIGVKMFRYIFTTQFPFISNWLYR